MPVYCLEECVAKAAAHLSGSAGPCGVDAEMLKNWLCPRRCWGTEELGWNERSREEITRREITIKRI
jgi:hypothetical protein